jgi:2-dehydropantoate 2-reductase
VALLSRLPGVAVRTLFWIFSRTQMTHDLGLLGPGEARMLIDQMTAAAPGKTEPLLAVRP